MKKRLYFIGTILILLIAASLIVSQVLLSSLIKKGITTWCCAHSIESSDFKCTVNLITKTITLKGLAFKQQDNDFRVESVTVSFDLLDLLSKRTARNIHIDKAALTLRHFVPFFPIPTTVNSDDIADTAHIPSKNPFLIDELRIDNLTLGIELPGGNKISDIHIEGLLKNIGANRTTTYLVKTSSESSTTEIKGEFSFDDWKKLFTYQFVGNNVPLAVINSLEEGFLPPQVREQLLSLYFKDILSVKLHGKVDITGSGEIKEGAIDSKLKFIVSDLSSETENENIQSLIKRISSKGNLEITYKIYGTLKNPFLKYDIAF